VKEKQNEIIVKEGEAKGEIVKEKQNEITPNENFPSPPSHPSRRQREAVNKKPSYTIREVVEKHLENGVADEQKVADEFGDGFEDALAWALSSGVVYQPRAGFLAVMK